MLVTTEVAIHLFVSTSCRSETENRQRFKNMLPNRYLAWLNCATNASMGEKGWEARPDATRNQASGMIPYLRRYFWSMRSR